MDMDSSSNIIVGGYTSSPTLQSSATVPNAYFVFYSSTGSIVWTMSINNNYNSVAAVKFEPLGTYIVAVITGSTTIGGTLVQYFDSVEGNL